MHAAFHIPELFELMLTRLEFDDLGKCLQVSKYFNVMILASRKLRKARWIDRPDKSDKVRKVHVLYNVRY